MALVGLKGLGGLILIWRLEDKELVGRANSNGASFIRWDATEDRFLTSIVFTNLKVDNMVNVFSVTGEKLASLMVEENNLLNVDFIHVIPGDYKPIMPTKIPYQKLDGSDRGLTVHTPGMFNLKQLEESNSQYIYDEKTRIEEKKKSHNKM